MLKLAIAVIAFAIFFSLGGFKLLLSLFWLWALVDCALNENNYHGKKVLWLLVIALTNVIGAAAYIFIRRPQRQKEELLFIESEYRYSL
ncbi:MAG: hypothetical protein COA79_05910 [Planctomycetota bacterium]|nr:MAG: hypothetical protein COA79_05910 [Planctomycetota bacterium]